MSEKQKVGIGMLSKEEIFKKVQAGEITSDEAYRLISELPEGEKMVCNVEAVLTEKMADTLKISISKIDADQDMREYGFDSVTLAEYIKIINDKFHTDMNALAIFECPSIRELAQWICKEYEKEVREYFGDDNYQEAVSEEVQEQKLKKEEEIFDDASETGKEKNAACEKINFNVCLMTQPLYLLYASKTIDEDHLMNFWYRLKQKEVKEAEVSNISAKQLETMQEAGYRYFHLLVKNPQGYKVEMIVAGVGRTILMLGGAGTTATFGFQQIKEFSKEYQVIAFHLPGCGLSDGIADLSLPSTGHHIISTMQQLPVKFPLNIIGSSWGAVLAVKIASMYPELVETLVLVAGNTNRELEYSEAKNVDMTDVHKALYGELSTVENGKDYVEIYDHSECVEPISFSAYIRYVNNEGSRQLTILHLLSEIKAPTLVVVGTEDKVTNINESRIIYSRIEDSEYYEIEGAGHMLVLTHADQFNARVREYYSDHIKG